jgi:acyl-CoA synthetase (AMP-forming)/AMP-acid ligase II
MEAWTPQGSTELIRKHRVTLANGAAAIHAALIVEAKADPDAYKTVRDFPSGGSARPPQLHDDLKAAVPSSIGTTAGYGMTEAPIVTQTRHRRPRRREAFRGGDAQRGRDHQADRPRRQRGRGGRGRRVGRERARR